MNTDSLRSRVENSPISDLIHQILFFYAAFSIVYYAILATLSPWCALLSLSATALACSTLNLPTRRDLRIKMLGLAISSFVIGQSIRNEQYEHILFAATPFMPTYIFAGLLAMAIKELVVLRLRGIQSDRQQEYLP
ncbi:hypothetical protein [Calycomorphotria hydatis]|uniref:Uncharacterized protein n=1 Tax=Calycomorphotria hydatis TaxID=2528027 RepID=A0A517TA11_9PLAN|nr:hypothetical protein [Calycomorphotria hydatis]QDT65207.1 hypothetical protein V22_24540 [Calycomorphotria hydatis]